MLKKTKEGIPMKAKLLGAILALVAVLCVLPFVSAANYTMDVKVNDQDTSSVMYVERGETIDVDVALEADEDVSSLRLVAWMSGYEPEDIRDSTEQFDLEANVKRVFHLKLALPADMETDENYYLHIDLRNHKGVVHSVNDVELRVAESRHKLDIMDVIISPSTSLEAGDVFFTEVRVENMGAKKEENVKVEVDVPELGLSTRTWLDDLVPKDSGDDESSLSTRPLMLKVPKDAVSGEYEVLVTVTYNRGRDSVQWSGKLSVNGAEPTDASTGADGQSQRKALITVDSSTKSLVQGEEKTFKLMFANLGNDKQTYTVKVLGAQLWGEARVDPAFVTVMPGDAAVMYVNILAREDAQPGKYSFTLQIRENNQIVKELNLGATVVEKSPTEKAAGELLSLPVLRLGFIGLVVILVIIGLVIAFKKLRDDDDYPLEPKDGKTYY